MKVNNNRQNINFNGTHVLKTNVLKRAAEGISEFIPLESNIIELNYNLSQDKKAVEELSKHWIGAEFIPMISSSTTSPLRRVFAITHQNENFDIVDSKKIFGIVDYRLSENTAHLSFLQANPEHLERKPRKIKSIGKSLVLGSIDFLRTQGINKLKVFSRQSEKPFYRKILPGIKDKVPTKNDSSNMVVSL